MCLEVKVSDSAQKDFIDKIGRNGITVYKVVGVDKRYFPPCMRTQYPFRSGLNVAEGNEISAKAGGEICFQYTPGFHFFTEEFAAQNYLRYLDYLTERDYHRIFRQAKGYGEIYRRKHKIIKCIVKKSWITLVGTESTGVDPRERDTHTTVVIVAKKARFPEFEE